MVKVALAEGDCGNPMKGWDSGYEKQCSLADDRTNSLPVLELPNKAQGARLGSVLNSPSSSGAVTMES